MIRMSQLGQNNVETHIGDNSEHGQGSGEQAVCNVPPNFGKMPPILPNLANNIGNLNYWLTLLVELMKRIPQLPTESPPKDKKL